MDYDQAAVDALFDDISGVGAILIVPVTNDTDPESPQYGQQEWSALFTNAFTGQQHSVRSGVEPSHDKAISALHNKVATVFADLR